MGEEAGHLMYIVVAVGLGLLVLLSYPSGEWRDAHRGLVVEPFERLSVARGDSSSIHGAPAVGAGDGRWRFLYTPLSFQ
jgi:hypothetical protein